MLSFHLTRLAYGGNDTPVIAAKYLGLKNVVCRKGYYLIDWYSELLQLMLQNQAPLKITQGPVLNPKNEYIGFTLHTLDRRDGSTLHNYEYQIIPPLSANEGKRKARCVMVLYFMDDDCIRLVGDAGQDATRRTLFMILSYATTQRRRYTPTLSGRFDVPLYRDCSGGLDNPTPRAQTGALPFIRLIQTLLSHMPASCPGSICAPEDVD